MYEANHLAHHLRSASVGRDEAPYAKMLDGKTLSYGAMFNAAEKYALALQGLGLNPGDCVAAQVEKSIESIQLYLGTVLA
jgi:malonyl-CoA/methylmalonyl-CoA synthetase